MSCRRTRQLSRPILSQPLLKSWLGRTPSTFPLSTIHPSVHRCVPIAYTGVNCRDRHLCIQPTEKRTRHFCRILQPRNETNAAFAYPIADRPLRRSRCGRCVLKPMRKENRRVNFRRTIRRKSSAADGQRNAAELPRSVAPLLADVYRIERRIATRHCNHRLPRIAIAKF